MSGVPHGTRIVALVDFPRYGLSAGDEGTVYDLSHPDTPAEVLWYAIPGEFAILFDAVDDDWWYSTPDEEGVTWKKI